MTINKKKDSDLKISDVVKKTLSLGLGAAFVTEDVIKSVLTDLSLPKDLAASLLLNAKNSKEEFLKVVKEELGKYLMGVDVSRLIGQLLDKYDLEIDAKIQFKKKSDE